MLDNWYDPAFKSWRETAEIGEKRSLYIGKKILGKFSEFFRNYLGLEKCRQEFDSPVVEK
jgi:hypothetical protein